jgi:predicted nucleotidyltransferase
MYRDFHAIDRWTKKNVHCIYKALVVAVATRHADSVDIKFLADGKPVWVVLPLVAWVEYKKSSGKSITDALAIAIAGRYLKTALESGEGMGREMYSLTVPQTLQHLEAIATETPALDVAAV